MSFELSSKNNNRILTFPLNPATDGQQTVNNFVADPIQETCSRQQVWIQVDRLTTCVRQHVSWCKRGLTDDLSIY